jgi:hypothetical protein
MSKRFYVILVFILLAFIGIFYWYYPNLSHEKMKRGILSQYLASQEQMNTDLNFALDFYYKGEIENFIFHLAKANEQTAVARALTGNGMPINNHNNIIDSGSLYEFQHKSNSIIYIVFSNAVNGTLTEEDIKNLEAHTKKINQFLSRIDKKKLFSGNTSGQIEREIESIIEETR